MGSRDSPGASMLATPKHAVILSDRSAAKGVEGPAFPSLYTSIESLKHLNNCEQKLHHGNAALVPENQKRLLDT